MERLSPELIEKILSSPNITVEDVINFSSTCTYFHDVILHSQVWKRMWQRDYCQEWPHLVNFLPKNYSYQCEFQYIYKLKKRVMALLEMMPLRYCERWPLHGLDFIQWETILNEKRLTFYYLVTYLIEIINTKESIKSIEVVPLSTPGNLTLQYYARKALNFINQAHLSEIWRTLKAFAPKHQTLERSLIFIAQWCHPEVINIERKVLIQINDIVKKVKENLRFANPQHPLFKTPQKKLDHLKNTNLSQHLWKMENCLELISAIRNTLYTELKFQGEFVCNFDHSFINKVLETRKGLPIILAVIYEAVGRRLGLVLEPINYPNHFLLRFAIQEESKSVCFYIDTCDGSNVMEESSCLYGMPLLRNHLLVANAEQVFQRVINNLELATNQSHMGDQRTHFQRSLLLELMFLGKSRNFPASENLLRLYSFHFLNDAEVRVATTIACGSESLPIERTDEVKFAVGMVILHERLQTKGVIHGWRVGIKNVAYKIILEDGRLESADQDEIIPCSEPGLLESVEKVGMHFSHFFENHFVPNAEMEKAYPFDTRVRHKFYHEMQLHKIGMELEGSVS